MIRGTFHGLYLLTVQILITVNLSESTCVHFGHYFPHLYVKIMLLYQQIVYIYYTHCLWNSIRDKKYHMIAYHEIKWLLSCAVFP